MRLPLHSQSAKNTLDIFSKRVIIKGNNKNMKINKIFHNIRAKIPNVVNEV
jgi:hypothetical protein